MEPSRRRLALWGCAIPLLGVVAFFVGKAGVHPPPDGVADVGIVPPITTVVVSWVALCVLWSALFLFPLIARRVKDRDPSQSGFRIADSSAGVLCLLLPFVLISGCTLYFAEAPGCGDPRMSLIQPLPPGVEIVDEQVGAPISGPDRRLELKLAATDGRSATEAMNALVESLRSRGWPLSVYQGYASAHEGEWDLWVNETSANSGQKTGTVSLELANRPADGRGCLDF